MKHSKLLGIEFVRGLAAYSVVLVPSGDQAWGLPVDSSAIEFGYFFILHFHFF